MLILPPCNRFFINHYHFPLYIFQVKLCINELLPHWLWSSNHPRDGICSINIFTWETKYQPQISVINTLLYKQRHIHNVCLSIKANGLLSILPMMAMLSSRLIFILCYIYDSKALKVTKHVLPIEKACFVLISCACN